MLFCPLVVIDFQIGPIAQILRNNWGGGLQFCYQRTLEMAIKKLRCKNKNIFNSVEYKVVYTANHGWIKKVKATS